jgi:NADH dehydrogenase
VSYAIIRPTWIPGTGTYPVQPVHVHDLARIWIDAAGSTEDLVIDAAGPETMSFNDLVALVRRAVNGRSPVIHVPPSVMAVLAHALGLLVGDLVLTPDEIRGLMAGLLASHNPPLGRIAFSQWLDEHKTGIGRSYANELHRHYATNAAA